MDVSKNNLVATFPKWSRHYEIEFDIIVQSDTLTAEYVNVLHMSNIEAKGQLISRCSFGVFKSI